jgi:tetratricopeptide (TPR) repeat protein
MWRRAFNGTNALPAELEQDMTLAVKDFERALAVDHNFTDAKIGAASCWQNISVLYYMKKDLRQATQLMEKSFPLLKESESAEPDNPRLLWVLGAYRFYNPPERGGGQAFAIETYLKGLKAAREPKWAGRDPLTPSWGEPELLMNLAFSTLHQKEADPNAAEQYARQALALVPYWQYVRDILMPQIQTAKSKNVR